MPLSLWPDVGVSGEAAGPCWPGSGCEDVLVLLLPPKEVLMAQDWD